MANTNTGGVLHTSYGPVPGLYSLNIVATTHHRVRSSPRTNATVLGVVKRDEAVLVRGFLSQSAGPVVRTQPANSTTISNSII